MANRVHPSVGFVPPLILVPEKALPHSNENQVDNPLLEKQAPPERAPKPVDRNYPPIDPTGPLPIEPPNKAYQFSEEDKEQFIDALSFLARKGAQTYIKSHQKINVLVDFGMKVADKTLLDQLKAIGSGTFNGNALEVVDVISKVCVQVATQMKIAKMASSLHPEGGPALLVSSYIELLRPGLQNALQGKIQEARTRQELTRQLGRQPMIGSLPWTGYEFLYSLVEITSWPGRLLNYTGKVSCNLLENLVTVSTDCITEGVENFKKEGFLFLSPEGATMLLLQAKERSDKEFQLRSAATQEEKRDSIPDQEADKSSSITSENEPSKQSADQPVTAEVEAKDKNIAPKYRSNSSQQNNWLPFTLPAPIPIVKYIKENLGGSFFITNDGGRLRGGVQVSMTIAGSKASQSGTAAARAQQTIGSGTGGSGGPVYNERRHFLNGLAQRWETFKESGIAWEKKREELVEIENSLSADDTPETRVTKYNKMTSLITSAQEAEKKLREDAFEVYKRTDKKARDGIGSSGKKGMKKQHRVVKEFIFKDLEISRHKHQRSGSLSESKRGKELDTLKTNYNAQKSALESYVEQDKALSESCEKYQEEVSSIEKMKESNQPLDLKVVADRLKGCEQLKEQVLRQIQQIRNSPTKDYFKNDSLNALENSVNAKSASLSVQSIQYARICSGYKIYQKKKDSESSLERSQREQALRKEMDEIKKQGSLNQEENTNLLFIQKQLQAEQQDRSYNEKKQALSATYQQFCDNANSIMEMENSDSPVDLVKMAEKLKRNDTLRDQICSQANDMMATLPELVNQDEMKNFVKDVEDRNTALKTIGSCNEKNQVLTATYKQFWDNEDSIIEMENSDSPVDPVKIAEKLKQSDTLRDQIRGQVNDMTTTFPELVNHEKIKSFVRSIEDRNMALQNRSFRIKKILSDYKKYCDDYKLALPQLMEAGEASQKTIASLAHQKNSFYRDIKELIAQYPENKEKNAELQLLLDDVERKHAFSSFCQKSEEEKSKELLSLKDQIKNSSSDQKQPIVDAYHDRAFVLFMEYQQTKEYKKLSAHYVEHVSTLMAIDSLSLDQMKLLSVMSAALEEAVKMGKISPTAHIALLIELEKKHLSQNKEIDRIAIAIGRLMSLSNDAKGEVARQRYLQCQEIDPDNPIWSHQLALSYLETFEWVLAEQSLAKALKIDPKNKETQTLVSTLVKDEFQNMALLLEWVHALSSPDNLGDNQELGRLKMLLNTIHTSTNILNHPSLQKKWLPRVLPTQFKKELLDYLNEDTSTNFNVKNTTTLATRIIPVLTALIQKYYSKEQHPELFAYSKQLESLSKMVQQVVSVCESCYKPYATYLDYKDNKSTGFACVSGVSKALFDLLPNTISLMQAIAYKDENAKRAAQLKHPNSQALVETVASKQFSSALMWSSLAYRSREPLRRWITRMTGVSLPHVGTVLTAMVVAYHFFRLKIQFYKEKAKILTAPPLPPATSTTRLQPISYLSSGWNWMNSFFSTQKETTHPTG